MKRGESIKQTAISGFAAGAVSEIDCVAMPVLAIGGESFSGSMMATVMRFATENVEEAIVPDSGHWIMEENPSATTKLVIDFLNAG
jgi:pimeloyl-ACP methyl ester carboxylesterase